MRPIYYIFFIVTLFIYYNKYCVGQPDDQDLLNCILFIMKKYFKGKCLCFVNLLDKYLNDEFELNLMKLLFTKVHSFYLLSSVNDTLKQIPYPCFYFMISNDFKKFNLLNSNTGPNFFLNNETVPTKHVFVFKNNLNHYEIYETLIKLFNLGHPDSLLINTENVIKAYTMYPFGKNLKNCPENGISVEMIDIWLNNSFINNLFPQKIPKLFNGCYLNVSFIEYVPYTIVKDYQVHGIEGYVMNIIGQNLNMSINWIQRNDINAYEKNGTAIGIFPDIIYGKSQIACGGLVNIPKINSYAQSTRTYATSYLMWYIPHPPSEPMWQILYEAFAPILLIFSIFTVTIAPIFIVFIAKRCKNELEPFKEIVRCYLATWAIAVGNTTGIKPQTLPLRLIYTAWIFCTFHLALAYTASLTGLITQVSHGARVKSFEQLKSTGFKTVMVERAFNKTTDINDKEIRDILNNFIIVDSTDNGMKLISKHKNMTLLDNSVYIDYKLCKNNRKPILYNTGLKAVAMQNGLIMRKTHYLYELVDKVISRLVESGINQKIIDNVGKCMKRTRKSKYGSFKATKVNGLSGVFIIHTIGLFAAIIVFCIELYINRRINTKFKQVNCNKSS